MMDFEDIAKLVSNTLNVLQDLLIKYRAIKKENKVLKEQNYILLVEKNKLYDIVHANKK